MAPILRCLVGIIVAVAGADSRRVEQRQTQRVVIGFVRAGLGIGENSYSKCSALIGQIEPLVRRDFKFQRVVVTALDRSQSPIVRRDGIRCGQRERRLQGCFDWSSNRWHR